MAEVPRVIHNNYTSRVDVENGPRHYTRRKTSASYVSLWDVCGGGVVFHSRATFAIHVLACDEENISFLVLYLLLASNASMPISHHSAVARFTKWRWTLRVGEEFVAFDHIKVHSQELALRLHVVFASILDETHSWRTRDPLPCACTTAMHPSHRRQGEIEFRQGRIRVSVRFLPCCRLWMFSRAAQGSVDRQHARCRDFASIRWHGTSTITVHRTLTLAKTSWRNSSNTCSKKQYLSGKFFLATSKWNH